MSTLTTEPRPWHCTEDGCGERLLWRRTSLDCPRHGTVCPLPSYPSEEQQQ